MIPPQEHDVADFSAFPIAGRWPAKHPDRIQLYSLNTPNGVKASIMLEETGLPYEAHLVDIMENESHLPEFLALNPNGKIRSEEHTSELQSLMRISYAVFCLKKKKKITSH